jgi:hypothetical protein
MIKIVLRAPASTHQHIDNGASDDDIMQFSTLFPQSIHIIMSSNVKIDLYIGKIKWFADFVLALMTTRV